MKVYVASSFSNQEEVKALQQLIVADGHTITYDWTVNDADKPELTDAEYVAFLNECGKKDYEGVINADVVVLINHPKCRDSMAEMGMAYENGNWVIVLYPERYHSVFFGLPGVLKANSNSDVISTLKALKC